MSLRIFHVVFIVASIALSAFVSVWGFWQYSVARQGGALALGVIFVCSGVALVIYGARVFGKLRDLSHDDVQPFFRH